MNKISAMKHNYYLFILFSIFFKIHIRHSLKNHLCILRYVKYSIYCQTSQYKRLLPAGAPEAVSYYLLLYFDMISHSLLVNSTGFSIGIPSISSA